MGVPSDQRRDAGYSVTNTTRASQSEFRENWTKYVFDVGQGEILRILGKLAVDNQNSTKNINVTIQADIAVKVCKHWYLFQTLKNTFWLDISNTVITNNFNNIPLLASMHSEFQFTLMRFEMFFFTVQSIM